VIGKTLAHYEILEKLGAGGMGEVYLANDSHLRRPVALKFVRPEDDPVRPRDALLREARSASALNHPNVCTIHAVGDSGSAAYIVMEYVEGETLADRIAAGPLAPEEVLAIAAQIASALDHAHGRGVVHRDLKSANVMVGSEGRVKVLDFGLSRRLVPGTDDLTRTSETLTDSGTIAGTFAYLSPEILRGETADEGSDLWALGVLLYEMCASERPFRGATRFELSAAILESAPPPLPPRIPPPIRALVARCLAQDPASRFTSAAALRAALEAAARGDEEEAPRDLRTLVVLPLDNLSGDPANDFFADGITEAITAAVARIGTLRVISRTSAMQFKGRERSLPEIARHLSADVVVEGSVVRVEDRVRITVQLVDARTDEHLWSASHDGTLSGVFDLQDEVARAIVNGIRGRIGPAGAASEPVGRTGGTRRVHPAAYEAFLRGRHAWAKRTPAALHRAIAHYEEAIELDPTFAPAHAGIAECYGVLGFQGLVAPRTGFAAARAAALRGLELDATLGSAHVALGYAALHHRWELERAAAAFEEGLRLDPHDPNGHHWYALLLTSRRERDAAVEQMRVAAELDPLSLIVRAGSGLVLHFLGDFDAAAAECRDALDLNPGYLPARWTLGRNLLAQERTIEALAILEPLADDYGRVPLVLGDYGRALGLAGRRDEAREIDRELEAAATRQYVRPFDRALVHIGLGEPDAALDWLDRAFEDGGNWLNYLHLDPAFARLRPDPRFESLVRRVAGSGS